MKCSVGERIPHTDVRS